MLGLIRRAGLFWVGAAIFGSAVYGTYRVVPQVHDHRLHGSFVLAVVTELGLLLWLLFGASAVIASIVTASSERRS